MRSAISVPISAWPGERRTSSDVAVTAIGGLIAIRGDFIPGFSQLDSQAQIVAYAFAFGLAQQLLTRLVDRQASALLERSPGKAAKVVRAKRAPQRQTQTDAVVPA